jgi:hypothetical protein
MTATFQFNPQGGTWDAADLVSYTLTLAANSVLDTSGNADVGGVIGTFLVKRPPDTTAPTATMQPPAFTPGATNSIAVVYSDDVLMDTTTIATGNVTLTGPNGLSIVGVFDHLTSSDDGATVTAVYTFTKANGLWNFTDNGTYTLTITPSSVYDAAGNSVTALNNNTFVVNLADQQPPTASLQAPALTTTTTNPYQFQITFTDPSGLITASLARANAVMVTGPNGYVQFATFVGMNPPSDTTNTTNMAPRTAIYQVTAPNGIWDSRAIGVYTVYLMPGGVTDFLGNTYAVNTQIGNFNVAVPDVLAPQTSVIAGDFSGLSNAVYTFQIQFTDGSGLNLSTIMGNNSAVTVSGPQGFQTYATFVGYDPSSMRATYRILGPNSQWSEAAAGAYYITVQPNQISDAVGNYITSPTLVTRPGDARLWSDETAAFYFSPNPLFNERYYLANNPDVRGAVASGAFPSGYYHFINHGQFEQRDPSQMLDTQYYLTKYPDIANAVSNHLTVNGVPITAWWHFNTYGAHEGRQGSPLFDPQYYLGKYPNIQQGVNTGALPSAAYHFARWGIYQNYDPSPLINAFYYMHENQIVQLAVANGTVQSPLEHFFTYDMNSGHPLDLSPTPLFNTTDYLAFNPDLQGLVDSGQSLLHHFFFNNIANGENRIATSQFDRIWYAATYNVSVNDALQDYVKNLTLFAKTHNAAYVRNPNSNFVELFYDSTYVDVSNMLGRGIIDSGWTHYVAAGAAEGRAAHA